MLRSKADISIILCVTLLSSLSPEYPIVHLGPPDPTTNLKTSHLPPHYDSSANAHELLSTMPISILFLGYLWFTYFPLKLSVNKFSHFGYLLLCQRHRYEIWCIEDNITCLVLMKMQRIQCESHRESRVAWAQLKNSIITK